MTRIFTRMAALRRLPLMGTLCAALLLTALLPSARAATLTTLHTFNAASTGSAPGDTDKLLLVSGNYYGVTTSGGSNNYGTVYQLTPAGVMTVLHEFTYYQDGANPHGQLVKGIDGKLYGVFQQGTASGRGGIFKINTDGTGYAVVYSFTGSATDGGDPYGGLVQDSAGVLYGTTQQAGAVGYGTVFKVKTDGTSFKDLHDFDPSADGYNPYYQLVLSGTTLYGSLTNGGSTSYGSVFSVSTTGTNFTIVHAFAASTDGAYPQGLILGADGKFYGIASQSGPSNYGTVYKMSTTGGGYTVVQAFDYTNTGGYLSGTLSQDSAGILYGASTQGGPNSGQGTIFKVKTDGTNFLVLHSFANNGQEGTGGDPGVTINGTTLIGSRSSGGSQPDGINRNLGTIFTLPTTGTTGFHVLYDFDTGFTDGYNSSSALVYDAANGNYYGTTRTGGWYNDGTIFKMTPSGAVTILYNFTNGFDGNQPFSTLVLANGTLYGSTYYGGTYGSGTVFQIKPDGTGFTTIYVFGQAAGASIPASLIMGADGNLYGTSYSGGQYNAGTVFELTLSGTETILHSFKGNPDGANPYGSLVQLSDNSFYGTTINGGVNNQGTIFKITPGGTLTVLHSFSAAADGDNPDSGVIQAADGKLYGTTSTSGPSGVGTIYSISTTGTGYHLVHQFSSSTDGAGPIAGVIQATDGKLYGTTSSGGPNGGGTAYRIATNGGSFSVLNAFTTSSTTAGYNLQNNLLEGPDGNFYGTTYYGGVVPSTEPNLSVGGTVFELVTQLPIITSFTPSHGPVGTVVTITGVNFIAGATVKFGSVSGTNTTVVSSTKITTKVPAGAPASSSITVTTSKGTATSAAKFMVP